MIPGSEGSKFSVTALNFTRLFPVNLKEGKLVALSFGPAVNVNFGHGWAVSFSPFITANWDAPDGNQWTIPIGLGLTRTVVFNHRPMNLGVSYYSNIKHPDGAAGEQLRFIVTLIFPR
jgi:hypothetical protein